MLLLAAPLRAFAQFDDPAFLGAVWRSVAWAVASILALAGLLVWGGSALVSQSGLVAQSASAAQSGWLSWLGGLLGGVGAALLAFYFFLPLATVIAFLFADRIAEAVEWRFYPDLPPARPAPLVEQAWDGLALGIRVLAWQVLALALLLIPPLTPIAAPLGWLVAAWAVGRGLFVAVAMRRMDRPDAMRLYATQRGAVVAQGALIVAGSLVPGLNLFVPVLGTAALVHVLHHSNPPDRDARGLIA